MNKFLQILIGFVLVIAITIPSYAQSTLNCAQCHSNENTSWMASHHGSTQIDVAGELAGEWAGLPADSVIFGQNAEDCIACHGPTSIAANGGMSEVQSLNYFFSTTGGVFTASTDTLNSAEWPSNGCTTCHDVQPSHPGSTPTLSIYNSPTAQYIPVANSSVLCGQCHGTLRYADTDHRRMDAWQLSKHGHGGQDDVASELSGEAAGSTPAEVTNDENCIACHASTSVLLNGGISESDALNLFFTTTGGVFTSSTVSQNTASWPEVACISCHDQHNPDTISYFNSGTGAYEVLSSSQELCGKCHGNLRFPGTDHLSYNIAEGTGGIDVPDLQTMGNIKCVDCHMHVGTVDGTNAAMYGGHLWNTFITEGGGGISASCTSCHPTMTAAAAQDTVNAWKAEYAYLDSIANAEIAIAADSLTGSPDSASLLQNIQANLAFAEGDESGGVHNHLYTISLLNNVITRSEQIISGIYDVAANSDKLLLLQNYPNPFSLSTNIEFNLPEATDVTIEIFNLRGQKIRTLMTNKYEIAGKHLIRLNAGNLPSGVYYCSMKAGNSVKAMKMTIVH